MKNINWIKLECKLQYAMVNHPKKTHKGDFLLQSKGDHQAQVHSAQMVLMMVRHEAGPPKKTTLGSQGT
jgi:hypothetical protein